MFCETEKRGETEDRERTAKRWAHGDRRTSIVFPNKRKKAQEASGPRAARKRKVVNGKHDSAEGVPGS